VCGERGGGEGCYWAERMTVWWVVEGGPCLCMGEGGRRGATGRVEDGGSEGLWVGGGGEGTGAGCGATHLRALLEVTQEQTVGLKAGKGATVGACCKQRARAGGVTGGRGGHNREPRWP
jgi:hypothetical protein